MTPPRRRVVIADDEPLARERLRMLLAAHPDHEVVAECAHGEEALDAITRLTPDLVLLDIRMPALTGLEVADALERRTEAVPAIVFVTAFDDHAIEAFEAGALDYLLKPVDRERLARALDRAAARPRATVPGLDPALRAVLETLRAERAYPRRFAVRDAHGGTYFVRADEIEWVDAQGNYVRLHARGQQHLVRDTMQAFEEKLDPRTFVRIHRSAIVNVDQVQRIEPYARGEHVVTMRDGSRLRTSRAHGARLDELLR